MTGVFLPDPFKLDVIRFLDSPAGKALTVALEERKPGAPHPNLQPSTKMSLYDQRAGYELAMAEMRRLPHESPPVPDVHITTLLDPRD